MFQEKTRILVVDDMKAMRMRVINQLKKMEYDNILEAENGEEAFEKIDQQLNNSEPVDLVLSDWNMPKMTGLDLLKNIRADERFSKLPFLMVTAEAEQSNVIIAVKAGVSNFVVKPFSIISLKEKIDKIFK